MIQGHHISSDLALPPPAAAVAKVFYNDNDEGM